MLVAFLHIIGIGVFYLLNHFDLMTVGLFAYFVITVAGLFIQNLVYVAESSKTRKGFMIYLLTYVPLVISLMIIAIKPGIK